MGDFLRRYVFNNLGLKLISLALAVGLWLAVARDPVAEVAVEVAIEFHNIPQNLEISSENIPRAQIRLRGPERIVRRLQPADVYAEVDLTNLRPGERTFDLTAQQIHEPSDLEVVQVVPSQLHLSLRRTADAASAGTTARGGNFCSRLRYRPDRRGPGDDHDQRAEEACGSSGSGDHGPGRRKRRDQSSNVLKTRLRVRSPDTGCKSRSGARNRDHAESV